MADTIDPFLTGKRRVRFVALQHALVPRSRKFGPAEAAAGLDLVNDLVGRQPPANRKRLALFLFIIDLLSVFTGLRTFRNLPPEKQNRVLHWLFDCPVPLLRKGFWGLNTMAKLSVYGQAAVYDEIGYELRANPAA